MGEHDRTICRLPREDRFLAARRYLHQEVIVRASQIRSPTEAEGYHGRVEAVAWGLEGSQDVIVLVLLGPKGAGMPTVAIELTKVLTIHPEEFTAEPTADIPDSHWEAARG